MTRRKATFGQRCRKARESAGMTLDGAGYRIRDLAPGFTGLSRATVNRIELEQISEEAVDPLVVLVLARAYGVQPEELSAVAAAKLEVVEHLLSPTFLITQYSTGALQLSIPFADDDRNLDGDSTGWTIGPPSNSSEPISVHAGSRPARSHATSPCTPSSGDGLQSAA